MSQALSREAAIEHWKATARLLDVTIERLRGEDGVKMVAWVRALVPDLAPQIEALRERAMARAQALLDRLEDEVLLGAYAAAAGLEAGAPTPLEEIMRELDREDAGRPVG